MDFPLISVIMPTYNRANIILQAIDSVIQQTYNNWELIIVNDGSTDNTKEVIKHYLSDKRVKAISKENGGINSARNAGLDISSGNFIAFLDDDDIWTKGKLEEQIKIFLNPQNKNVGLVYSDSMYFFNNINDNIKRKFTNYFPELTPYELLMTVNFICFSSTMLKRECFEHSGKFDTSFKTCADWEFLLRVLDKYKIYRIEKCLVYYRVHKDNISKNDRLMALNEMKLIKTYSTINKKVYSRAMWSFYKRRASHSFSVNNLWGIVFSILQMFRYLPFHKANFKFIKEKIIKKNLRPEVTSIT